MPDGIINTDNLGRIKIEHDKLKELLASEDFKKLAGEKGLNIICNGKCSDNPNSDKIERIDTTQPR